MKPFPFNLFAIAVGACSFGASAAPTATDTLLSQAPVFQLLLDNSGSSPATVENFVVTTLPIIEERLRRLPIGSLVLVNSVGDASLAPLKLPQMRIAKRIAPGSGTIDQVVLTVKQAVMSFPKRTHGQEHGQTHMVGGLFDASQNINPEATTPNEIVVLSDLIEFSDMANCYADDQCKLGSPAFSLKNTKITVLGVGMGLSSKHEIALFQEWRRFLDKTGAQYVLKKTF